VVAQLHVHVIARRSGDAGWPKPIWGVAPSLAHDARELDRFVSAIKRKVWVTAEGS
jgi:diadenosine tetraphosphate (Ap4A) HIT family hydrolase